MAFTLLAKNGSCWHKYNSLNKDGDLWKRELRALKSIVRPKN
jgi:hypothetical protein